MTPEPTNRSAGESAPSLPDVLRGSRLLLDSLLEHVVVVDGDRRIVYANPSFLQAAGAGDLAKVLGERFGNAINCTHACETAEGCGSTKFCQECGAFRVQVAAFAGESSVRECRITRTTGFALDFRVRASPWNTGDQPLLLITALDTSGDQRRCQLEQAFFHDVRTTAHGVVGLAGFLEGEALSEADEAHTSLIGSLARLSNQLAEEIDSYACLAAGERGELSARIEACGPEDFLGDLRGLFARQKVADGHKIAVDCPECIPRVATDPVLLSRVVGNFLRNALEATRAGEAVTLGARSREGRVEFFVRNGAVIPPRDQLSVFQRSFSTKGPGRGLGTFAARLIGERYLGGQVGFTSSVADGTEFWIRLPESLESADEADPLSG